MLAEAVPISWGPDHGAAIEYAHDLFRWFAAGWDVNADLPAVDRISTSWSKPSSPMGKRASPTWASVQIGDSTPQFLDEAAGGLLAKLRAAEPASS